MHIPTHILSGWCVASVFSLTARERCFAMVAAAIADVDGVGYLAGEQSDAYQLFHHVLGHNVFFGLVACGILAAFLKNRIKAGLLYVGLFHLHLLLDYFGSGPGWAICYIWPVSRMKLRTDLAWDLFSWQNITAGYALVALTIYLAWRQRRTPLEYVMPELDRKLVTLLRRETQESTA
jgi:hypothetical protein